MSIGCSPFKVRAVASSSTVAKGCAQEVVLETGGLVVGDRVEIEIEIAAVKEEATSAKAA
jgi:hypothetical protein